MKIDKNESIKNRVVGRTDGMETYGDFMATQEIALASKEVERLQRVAHYMEQSIPVRKNRYRLWVYKDTFIGSECVDYLVRSKFASSRSEAVDLGRRIANEFNLFEHVTLDHELKDDFFFYRFTDSSRRTGRPFNDVETEPLDIDTLVSIAKILKSKIDIRDRIYNLKRYCEVFVASQAITVMVELGLVHSRDEGVELGRRLEKELHFWHHVTHDHKFKDRYLFFRLSRSDATLFSDTIVLDQSSTESNQRISVPIANFTRSHLYSIAEQLRHGLRVKDRVYRFKTYQICFVASEAVDLMVKSKFVPTRAQAVELGRRLGTEFQLWHHVTNDHDFQDAYLFFQFSSAADPSTTSDHNRTGEIHQPSTTSVDDFMDSSFTLGEIAIKLLRGVQVADRTYKLKKYKRCFIGCEMVDFMVQARVTPSRQEAVNLGQQLALEHNLFHHVTHDLPFQDDYLFYRFSTDANVSSLDEASSSEGNERSDNASVRSLSDEDLVAVGDQLRRAVRIKNRQYRLKTYKNCFIASEAVDYLVQAGVASSRESAVEIGKRLSSELNFLHHVTNDHLFTDSYVFFRFTTNERRQSTFLSDQTDQDLIQVKRLQFENNLSWRQVERQILIDKRKAVSEAPQVVLIGGPCGCGISSLVLHTFSEDVDAIFATAKFDQRFHATPFHTLRLLFMDLCKRILVSSKVENFRSHLKEEFSNSIPHVLALSSWIPEMGLLLDLPVDKCPKRHSDSILPVAIYSFIHAVSTMTPVVLCLDDIMWSDSQTFGILLFILTRNMRNIMFCGTFRDNEVSPEHPFIEWRSQLEDCMDVETILLRNLDLREIRSFLCDSFKRDDKDIHALSELLLERTHGNLYFLIQALENLQDQSLICYDYASLNWKFSIDTIRRKTRAADNVGRLLSVKIEMLPRDVQQVLKLGSCFGSSFDPDIVEQVKSVLYIFGDIDNSLQTACQEELLISVSDRQYIFAHDTVQSVAYELLPNGYERQNIHWDIGLTLSTRGHNGSFEWYFLVADQMILSGDIMEKEMRQHDRSKIANIFLKAGENAAEISAFVPASQYLKKGITVLGGDTKQSFTTNYRLATKLFGAYAKILISCGDVEQAREISETLAEASRSDEDKRSADLSVFFCLSIDNKLEQQINFGIKLLDDLGVKIPNQPSTIQLSIQYDRAMSDLHSYEDEELFALPSMYDSNIEFCMCLMCDLIQSGNALRRIPFVCYTLAKLVKLTLQHGVCKFTPLIFVLVGRDRIANQNDLKGGRRFVNIGLRFQENSDQGGEEKGRLLAESCMAIGCVEPLAKTMQMGLDGYKASMKEGDTNYAFRGVSIYLWSFFYSGLPFHPLLDDVGKFSMQMLEYKQTGSFFRTIPIYQMLLCLSGQEDDNGDITEGRAIDLQYLVERNSREEAATTTSLWSYGMQLAVYMEDELKAMEYYERLKNDDMGLDKATAEYHIRIFFFSLIAIQAFRKEHKRRFKNEAKRYLDILRELVDGGAINLPHKVVLLETEFTSLTVKDFSHEVLRKYERAVVAASRAGFLQDGALANHLCGKYCIRHGHEEIAEMYLQQAHKQYTSWGAIAVANSIKEKYSDFIPTKGIPVVTENGFRSRARFRDSFALIHKSLSMARGFYNAEEERRIQSPPGLQSAF